MFSSYRFAQVLDNKETFLHQHLIVYLIAGLINGNIAMLHWFRKLINSVNVPSESQLSIKSKLIYVEIYIIKMRKLGPMSILVEPT